MVKHLLVALVLSIAGAVPAIAQIDRPVAGPAPASAVKTFTREDLASDGVRLEAQLKTEAGDAAGTKPTAAFVRDGDVANARNDLRGALSAYAKAIATDPRAAAGWLRYSNVVGRIDPKDGSERYSLRVRATAAAYVGYQRAATQPDEIAGLDALGAAFVARENWRPALTVYKARLDLADVKSVHAVYDDLLVKHGFRITGYNVESDAAAPRVCFQFSESLAPKVDFTPFVAISGATNGAVTPDDSQLCVDGLKHGERYAFVLRQGLPSAIGENLLRSADYDIYVRDRSPQARFTGRNYVLPRTGQTGIPIVSVNTPKIDVEVLRIGDRSLLPTLRSEDFLSQLSGTTARTIAEEKGFRVWSGTLDTARTDLNVDSVTAFPVLQAVGKLEPGLYIMTAQPAGSPKSSDGDDDYAGRATQWFVVSDFGLTAFSGPDGVHVMARSLSSAEPIANADIRLVAKNNEVLATKKTDRDGIVAFDPGLSRGTGGTAPGLVVAALGDDYGFLDLSSQAFDLADRGVKGRPAPGGPEALLFAERGVYRSGETVYLTALLRDARGAALERLPLTLVVKRPDGVEYKRAQVADEGQGGRAFPIPLLPAAAHGTWRVTAYTDPKGTPVGSTSFLVEDYVPERLDLTLASKAPALTKGEPAAIDVAARFLYGAPGADLDVSGNVTVALAAKSAIKGLEAFTIGLDDETVEPTSTEIEEHERTDDKGRVTMSVPITAPTTTRPTEAKIALQVAEDGGRAVTRALTLPILPDGPVLAVHDITDGNIKEGGNAAFDVAAAAPDGTRLAKPGVTWTLFKVSHHYQWYLQNGRWTFEPVKAAQQVATGTLDLTTSGFGRIAHAVEYGSYRLEVRASGLATASASFTVGWSGDETADVPDLLDMTLDKAAYATGEVLHAHLSPRFAGKATVAIVSDKINVLKTLDLPAGGASIDIPVDAEWGAGAYLVATAYRPLDTSAKRLPGRAMGVAWFSVDRAARTLDVKLDAPATIRPRGKLTVPVRLAGLKAGETAHVTLAAVDVGILNLTHYALPDAYGFFFGQKILSSEVRDLYGYLIDGMSGTLGAIHSGGDSGGSDFTESPPSQAPLARYSGVVTVGADGTANVTFDIPAFNGTARLMAVAWTAGRIGSATADTIIRDPVVLTGTLPRFLSVGDQSRFSVTLDNVEAPAGDYVVDLDLAGPVLLSAEAAHRTVHLAKGGKATLVIPLTAAGPGQARLDVRLTGAGIDGAAGQSFALAIQPGTSTLVRRTVRPLEPGASLTVSNDLLADILPGTGLVSVSASPAASLDVPALLASLDRYPYGCTEQTISRALPLLYVNRLAALDRQGLDTDVDGRVRESIDRLLARQGSDGSFGLWDVGGTDVWLDAYTTDFLTRARERGFAVPQSAFAIALDRLRNTLANTTDVGANGPDLAYAAYVLARNGRPVMGDLRYLVDTQLSAFTTPLARGQIAAALALLGDRTRSQTALASALDALRANTKQADYRTDYGSRLRDGAGLLALAGEADLGRDVIRPLTAVLDTERATNTRTLSTQEEAWMVLAAQSLTKDAETQNLEVDGAPAKGPLYRSYKAGSLDSHAVTIANRGKSATQIVVNVAGNPVGPEPAESHGYGIERTAYKLDGTPVDLAHVRQNDRIAIVLKVTETQARGGKLLLVDRLPAGLEIENPKLADADAFSELPMLKSDVQPDHTEFRDDRFVATYERAPSQSAFFTVGYVVRAVSPGRYTQPAATIEDMYRPDRYGRTAFGTVEVAPARP